MADSEPSYTNPFGVPYTPAQMRDIRASEARVMHELKHEYMGRLVTREEAEVIREETEAAFLRIAERENLSGAMWGGKSLGGADLKGIDLSGASLVYTCLELADLSEADLHGADLLGADLKSAYLQDANLSRANVFNAKLHRANLSSADLSGATIQGANLRAANLRQANLSGANLCEADLFEAYLQDTNLRGANLQSANLKDAILRDCQYGSSTVWPQDFDPVKEISTRKQRREASRIDSERKERARRKKENKESWEVAAWVVLPCLAIYFLTLDSWVPFVILLICVVLYFVIKGVNEGAFAGSVSTSTARPRLSSVGSQRRREIPLNVRHQVFRNAKNRCQQCGKSAADGVTLEVDHIMPVSKGGSDDISNLQLLCFECNSGKSDRVH